MASTGCGKTFANARIMYGLADSKNGCRFSVALGLRTLTLQTGSALREKLELSDDDLALLIGSEAVKALHQYHQEILNSRNKEISDDNVSDEFHGSESAETLLAKQYAIDYEGETGSGLLRRWLATHTNNDQASKLEKLLNAPVLVSTIDYLMPATEGERGGKQIAPMLRLLTSDLVLDEPDDFDQSDLPALCRLVNWAGMLGSRVLLSSATLPPAVVEALFCAYQTGRVQFNRACGQPGVSPAVCCAWFDETLAPQVGYYQQATEFAASHKQFVEKRAIKLRKQTVLRRAELLPINVVSSQPQDVVRGLALSLQSGIYKLHQDHHQQQQSGGKCVSIGLIRMANIRPMVAVAKLLLAQTPPVDYEIRFCIYHSRHPLVVRSELEKNLDQVLNRHDPEAIWQVPTIKSILQTSPARHIVFLVFATAVAEVGRDHDYDWAIAEPSSMRSLIQLAGRIQRHRKQAPTTPNMLILDSNYRALTQQTPAYCWPGFETIQFPLASTRLNDILRPEQYREISAIPRIQAPENPDPENNLSDLEHVHLRECLLGGENTISAYAARWWGPNLSWSAELQKRTRFRASRADEHFVLYLEDKDEEPVFYPMNEKGHITKLAEKRFQRETPEIADRVQPWCDLAIKPLLQNLAETKHLTLAKASERFAGIRLPEESVLWCYTPQFGIYRALE